MKIVIVGLSCVAVGFVFGYLARMLCDSSDELSAALGRLSKTVRQVQVPD